MKAILASNNKNKVKEIKMLLADKFSEIYSLKDQNINIEIEENGATFLENAIIKAKTIADMTNMVAIADDSGLCVEALGGAPGVYSARYAGEPCDDDANNAKLLENLHNLEKTNEKNRKAYFVSVVVVYYPDGHYVYGEGKVEGHIIDQYLGENGFGYDPIFFCDQLNKTFGQAQLNEKNLVSHRARALENLVKKL